MQAHVRADVTSASAHKLGLIISHVEKDHFSTHLILTMARVMGLGIVIKRTILVEFTTYKQARPNNPESAIF
jgi:hypothetical protein